MNRPPINRKMIEATPSKVLGWLMNVRKYLRYCPTTIYVEQYFDLIYSIESDSSPVMESKERALDLIVQALDN